MTHYDRLLLATARICLALVCLMPLVVSYSTIYPFVVGKALFARSLVEVALGAWLLLAWRVPGYRPRPSVILLALLAWLAVSALASFAGVNPTRSLWSDYARMHGVVELAHWFGFILVAAAVFRTIPSWRRLLAVNLAVGAVVSALGLAQYLGLVDWIFIFSTAQRAGSTLGSGLYLGAYAAMNAGLGRGAAVPALAGRKILEGLLDPLPAGRGGGARSGRAVVLRHAFRVPGGGGDGAGFRRGRVAAGTAPDRGERGVGAAGGSGPGGVGGAAERGNGCDGGLRRDAAEAFLGGFGR